MEDKDFELIAGGLLEDLSKGLFDEEFNFISQVTILSLLLEKGIITEEEFKEKSEVWNSYLVNIK